MTSGIKGPTDGPSRIDAAREADPVDLAEPVDELAPAQAAQPIAAAAGTDRVSEVAAALRAGTITVEYAVERLIEETIGGERHRLTPALEGELRALLRSYAESDPFLASRIRNLMFAK